MLLYCGGKIKIKILHRDDILRPRSATPVSKPGPAKLHGPVSKTPNLPICTRFDSDLAGIVKNRSGEVDEVRDRQFYLTVLQRRERTSVTSCH